MHAGSATTFVPGFDLIALCYQLGTVLFTAYVPFRAREFESKGRYNYIHVVAVINSIIVAGFLVGAQLGLGGYSRTVVHCLADASSSFAFAIVPTSPISHFCDDIYYSSKCLTLVDGILNPRYCHYFV